MLDRKQKVERFTENAKKVLKNSYEIAKKYNHTSVRPEHLFISLLSLKECLASKFLANNGIDLDKTVKSIEETIKKKTSSISLKNTDILVSDEVKKVIEDAFVLSYEWKHVYIGTEHILLAMVKQEDLPFVKELKKAGLTFESLKQRLFVYASYLPAGIVDNADDIAKAPEAIDFFGRNLNKIAIEGKLMPIIGRDKEIDRLIRILSRQTKNNPILVGEAGVGKTAVVEGFVQRIIDGMVPDSMKNIEIYQIDVASIVAGSKVRGDIEQRLLVLLSEVSASKNKILFIDEIHMIVGAGAAGPNRGMDIANILKPRLTDGSIRVIGATTNAEYREFFEDDAALSRRFQPIIVEEIDVDAAEKILRGIKSRFEKYHGVKISKEAISQAAKLSNRYITDRYLPDKAIDVLDEACSLKKLFREKKFEKYEKIKSDLSALESEKNQMVGEGKLDQASEIQKEEERLRVEFKKLADERKISFKDKQYFVDENDIKKVIAEWTGIPVETLSLNEIKSLENITRKLSGKIIGQSDAIKRVANALKRTRLGLSAENRPLASFLFLGPTGVGKTEMAKVIAREFFGSEKSLIQIDMSEYMEQHSVAKIVGAPPGYIGYQEGGHLTEKIRKKPYAVVLFDEIEKAHPELLNILLQILEEGVITDSKGRKINFKNTIIIMTSNIGASDIGEHKILGFSTGQDEEEKVEEAYSAMHEKLIEELKASLKPEFINRIDEIVIFRGLNIEDAKKIVLLLLKELEKRLKDKKISLEVSDEAVNFIASEGFSNEYGARNLRRKIQELVETEISDLMIKSKGALSKVRVSKAGKKLVVTGD